MTTPPASRIAVERTEDGHLYWYSSAVAAVAEVDVDIAPGVRAQVDAAAPAHVLAWELDADADPIAIANAVTDPTVSEAIARARSGATVTLAPLQLTEPWARLALTEAVSRWTPNPIDEAALLLDEAAAQQRTGNALAAARLVAIATPVLEELSRKRLEGHLVGGPAFELTTIAEVAAEAVSDRPWGVEIESLARQLDTVGSLGDDELDSWLRSLTEEHSATSAISLSGSGGGTTRDNEFVVSFHPLDPHAVPARAFGWNGAETDELIAEYRQDSGDVLLTVRLADHLDPELVEDGQFLAYAAEKTTGRLLTTRPMTSGDRALSAVLPLHDTTFDQAIFGIFHADIDIRALRTTPLNLALVQVDRMMIAAWAYHRTALSTLQTVDASADDTVLGMARRSATAMIARARTAATNARNQLLRTLEALPVDAEDVAALLNARSDAIQRYIVTLRRAIVPDDGTRPLLAEMLPVEPWDEGL